MAQEKEIKKRGRKKGQVVTSKLSDELKAVLVAAKKLNYDDLKFLKETIIKVLDKRKEQRINEIKQELSELES